MKTLFKGATISLACTIFPMSLCQIYSYNQKIYKIKQNIDNVHYNFIAAKSLQTILNIYRVNFVHTIPEIRTCI